MNKLFAFLPKGQGTYTIAILTVIYAASGAALYHFSGGSSGLEPHTAILTALSGTGLGFLRRALGD